MLRGSGRFSVENAALSFAYDPRRGNARAVARRLERRLGPELRVALLRAIGETPPQ